MAPFVSFQQDRWIEFFHWPNCIQHATIDSMGKGTDHTRTNVPRWEKIQALFVNRMVSRLSEIILFLVSMLCLTIMLNKKESGIVGLGWPRHPNPTIPTPAFYLQIYETHQ